MRTISAFCFLLSVFLVACGPSAKQQARSDFRAAVAAMKVCTQGATYEEFRAKRLALETCYTANQSALADQADAIEQMDKVMDATDLLWNWNIKYPGVELFNRGDEWNAMLVLCPAISAKENYTMYQRERDGDFNAENYVKLGLTLTSRNCDELLASK
jgi:hypothetical protein